MLEVGLRKDGCCREMGLKLIQLKVFVGMESRLLLLHIQGGFQRERFDYYLCCCCVSLSTREALVGREWEEVFLEIIFITWDG